MSKGRQQKNSLMAQLYEILFRQTFVPLFLIVTTPLVSLIFPYIIVVKNSHLTRSLIQQSWKTTALEAWAAVKWNDLEVWSLILGLLLWGIISLHFPGPKYHGPPTPNGFRPTYWHNGFRFYMVSTIISAYFMWNYSMLHWYYKVPSLVGILIVTGFILCLLLYIKGMFMTIVKL